MNHHHLEPTVIIGKAGITNTIIDQVKNQLKKRKQIKVKFLASALAGNKKELTEELAQKTNSRIAHRVGFVVVLERTKQLNTPSL